MKTNYLSISIVLFLAVQVTVSCQKETLKSSEDTAFESLSARSEQGQGCRVTAFDFFVGIENNHQVDYFSYQDGRLDEWQTTYGMDYRLAYHADGTLKTAKGYDGENLVYTIVFFYERGRVAKELWYEGDTDVVIDDYVYTYDTKGQNIKAESTILGYYNENVYTPDGDLESWKFYDAGSPVVSGHYTYLENYRSPMAKGTPGVTHNFPYSNSTFGRTKWWYSSERIIFYDPAGDPFVYYDQDPLLTEWQVGESRYPEYVDYIDKLSGVHFGAGFEYENCRNGSSSRLPVTSSQKVSKELHPLGFIRNHPSKSIKDQIAELKESLKY